MDHHHVINGEASGLFALDFKCPNIREVENKKGKEHEISSWRVRGTIVLLSLFQVALSFDLIMNERNLILLIPHTAHKNLTPKPKLEITRPGNK